MREVVLEKIVPETWELITLDGLSPPQCKKLEALKVSPLAEAFSVILIGITQLGEPLSLLLARAQERSTADRRPFLLNFR